MSHISVIIERFQVMIYVSSTVTVLSERKLCISNKDRRANTSIIKFWASLVAQWLRVCLPMQGIRVRALVWEDPTCRGAAGPVSHNC